MASFHALCMQLVGSFSRPTAALVAGFILLVVFFLQGLFFIRANSPTYDEPMHLAAGYSYLATRDFRLEPENPPLIKEALALPHFLLHRIPFRPDRRHWESAADYLVGQEFLYKSAFQADELLALSRVANLVLGASLLALTGWWAYRIWGERAALLAMALACFEPNLVAHSSLVTTDVGVTLFILLSIYLLWEYQRRSAWSLLIAVGISTGLALSAKYSAILLLPMIALIVLSSPWVDDKYSFLPLRQHSVRLAYKFLESAAVIFIIAFVAVVMIPPWYFFQGFQPWLSGFQQFLALGRKGMPTFFFGEYSHQGWWTYFILCFLIKTPIGIGVLFVASLALFHRGRALEARDALFLLLPPLVVFAAMSQGKTNIGLRHVLPAYPFLFVLAGRLATVYFQRRWCAPFAIASFLLFAAVSSLRIAPHQLAYFNELVGGPEHGYRYLSDSNLDWGQDLRGVKTYMEKENLPIIYLSYFGTAPPSYYGIRYQYVPGTWPLEWPPPTEKVPTEVRRKLLAISAHNLQDVSNPYNPLFRWLWTRHPIAKIGYSIFVYDLTDDSDGLAKLDETYTKAGVSLTP